jgi:hypothetical protein
VCTSGSVANTQAGSQELLFQGVLQDIVTVGSHTSLYVDVGGTQITVRHIGMPAPGLAVGHPMVLRAERGHVHFVADAG